MTPYIVTSYVSRVCDVPPLVASAALDELVRVTPRLVGPTWELRLQASGAEGAPGLLSARWGQRAPVVVELERWSSTRSVLGLRHRTRGVPWWSAGYFASAHEAAKALAGSIEDWADWPLRDAMSASVLC